MCRLSCTMIYLFCRFLKRTCSFNKNMHVLQETLDEVQIWSTGWSTGKILYSKRLFFCYMLFKLLRYLTPVFPVPKHSWLDACYYSIHSNIFMISHWSFIDYILVPKISPNTDSNTAKFLIFTFVSYTAWKVSVFGVILVRIFPHSDWICSDLDLCLL